MPPATGSLPPARTEPPGPHHPRGGAPANGHARLPDVVRLGPYTFKPAETDDELEQVHQLNYATFVREVPQHADPGNGRLVDKFHEKNLYFVGKRERRVIGMISVHWKPPFSIVEKLADPSVLERLGGVGSGRLLEVRLLAIGPAERSTMVFGGLGWCLHRFAQENGYSHIVISGIQDRQRMYERLGFEPLGPPVKSGDAWFIPMFKMVGREPESMAVALQRFGARVKASEASRRMARFTPGPVQISPTVGRAFRASPVSHRGAPFIETFEQIRTILGDLVGGSKVALFAGSGTLANDSVAAALAADQEPGPGLVLTNGEFGERIARQAARAGLSFRTLSWEWGQPWDLAKVESALASGPRASWVWGVHLESSTGVLNDLQGLVGTAQRHSARVCLDCISSLGAVPLDLSGVYLASGASGKSLGSYAGLAFVFAQPSLLERTRRDSIAPSHDAAGAIEARGPRFTFASPQVAALREALSHYETAEGRLGRYKRYRALGRIVRRGLRAAGIEPIAADGVAAPVITSFRCPKGMTSARFVSRCRSWGFEVSGLSEYLERRAWSQIATMGAVRPSDVRRLLGLLAEWNQPKG